MLRAALAGLVTVVVVVVVGGGGSSLNVWLQWKCSSTGWDTIRIQKSHHHLRQEHSRSDPVLYEGDGICLYEYIKWTVALFCLIINMISPGICLTCQPSPSHVICSMFKYYIGNFMGNYGMCFSAGEGMRSDCHTDRTDLAFTNLDNITKPMYR